MTDSKATILVADDDEALLSTLAWILNDRGYEVITLADGAGLIERMEEVRPDLLMLDIMMPRVDGLQLLQQIRSDDRWSESPTVLPRPCAGRAAHGPLRVSGTKTLRIVPLVETRVDEEVERAKAGQLHRVVGRHARQGILPDASWRGAFVRTSTRRTQRSQLTPRRQSNSLGPEQR